MADFDLVATTYTLAEYCAMLERQEVRVNRAYQRSDKVWPQAAQSFLIETILCGYPVPKLSLYQITDLKTRKTVKEIVDGQQRTRTIQAFYRGNLRLSKRLSLDEAAGRVYDDLSDELKTAFLEYPISVDVFTGATPDQIREVFRRINSYTVPLNYEEQRHAVYQGEMKWFIYGLSRDYDEAMLLIGTFSERKLVRMADAKLYAEVVHALDKGISTTNRKSLDSLYKEYDSEFPQAPDYAHRFEQAIAIVLELEDLHNGPLVKPHMLYSLLLAIMHVVSPITTLQPVVLVPPGEDIDFTAAVPRLTALADALEAEEPEEQFADFLKASQSKTNVGTQRETRVAWLVDALLAR